MLNSFTGSCAVGVSFFNYACVYMLHSVCTGVGSYSRCTTSNQTLGPTIRLTIEPRLAGLQGPVQPTTAQQTVQVAALAQPLGLLPAAGGPAPASGASWLGGMFNVASAAAVQPQSLLAAAQMAAMQAHMQTAQQAGLSPAAGSCAPGTAASLPEGVYDAAAAAAPVQPQAQLEAVLQALVPAGSGAYMMGQQRQPPGNR